MNSEEIMNWALMLYGQSAQKMMAIEECSEFINAIAKEKRSRAGKEEVITEIADVMIMMEQMAIIYGKDAVEEEKSRKLARLENRIRADVHCL